MIHFNLPVLTFIHPEETLAYHWSSGEEAGLGKSMEVIERIKNDQIRIQAHKCRTNLMIGAVDFYSNNPSQINLHFSFSQINLSDSSMPPCFSKCDDVDPE